MNRKVDKMKIEEKRIRLAPPRKSISSGDSEINTNENKV